MHPRRHPIWKSLIAAFAALALVAATAAPPSVVLAQTKTEKTTKTEPSAAQKAQQQRMKDCAKDWGEYKKKTGKSGQKEHRAFMSDCLKGPATKKEEKKDKKKAA